MAGRALHPGRADIARAAHRRRYVQMAVVALQRAIAGHEDDPVLVSFLVSRVYTALNLWREDITDVDERSFHARHLAWLAERGGS